MSNALGIIAGNGEFPLILAESARRQGIGPVVAAAFEGETSTAIGEKANEVEWVRLGQLNRLIEVFTKRGIHRAVMAGGITPSNLFKKLSLDLRMIAVAARLPVRNAETIFGAIAAELAKDGVELLDPRPFLAANVPAAGVLSRRQPDSDQQADIDYGLKIAKQISRLDIGQTVVVRHGTVLAVEGFEGTDQCIRRGGELAGAKGGAVVVKVAKPNQDFRFDIPCIGTRTIESCQAGRIAVLAIEAGATLLLGREAVLGAADAQKLVLLGIEV